MKVLSTILALALAYTIYLLISQHNELYHYRNLTGMDNCLIDSLKAKRYMKNYTDHFSCDSNKTQAIWFSEDIIRCLYINIIREDKGDTIDGFRVYLATYPEKECPSGTRAKKPIANTVLFVPTYSNDSGRTHHDLWALIRKNNEIQRVNSKLFEVPNHGELCPNSCNQ